jgi:hypothetical protein
LGTFPIEIPTCSSRKTDGPEYLKKNKNEKRGGIIFLKFIKGTDGFFNTDQPIPVAKFYKIPEKIISWLKLQQRQRWIGCCNWKWGKEMAWNLSKDDSIK